MKKQEIDHILTRMLDAYDNVSDLNITVGKPFQIERFGLLTEVELSLRLMQLRPSRLKYLPLTCLTMSNALLITLYLRDLVICHMSCPVRHVSG